MTKLTTTEADAAGCPSLITLPVIFSKSTQERRSPFQTPLQLCVSTFRTLGLSKEQVATGSGGAWRAELTGFESVSLCSCLTLPDQQRLRLKSPVLKKQACPQWKHSFVFKGVTPSQLRQSSLELTVWDQATFGVNDRFLGGARLGSSKSV